VQITLNIPDEFAAQVQARGIALEAYIRELMEERLSRDRHDQAERENAVEAMLQFTSKHGFTSGGNGVQGMIHQGHRF
jgi:hypothetical protein